MCKSNIISKSAHIDSSVKLGVNNVIENNVVIKGNVIIGDNNYFASGTTIGGASRQRLRPAKWDPSPKSDGQILIGNNNLFFESVNIRKAMMEKTIIENNVSIGAHTHVGHDSIIRSNTIISINISLGGYTIIGHSSNIGMGVCIHPRCVIGSYTMCGMGAIIKGHVLPALTVFGVPAKSKKINRIGLKRYGFSESEIINLDNMYRHRGKYSNTEKIDFKEFYSDCNKWKKNNLNIKYIYLELKSNE